MGRGSRAMTVRAAWGMILFVLALGPTACGSRGNKETENTSEKAPTLADSGIVVLDQDGAAKAGIETSPAGPATIDVLLQLPGKVRFDPGHMLEVKPRFAGVVRELKKDIGQAVAPNDVVALVESNESLTNYSVTSSIAGRVIARPVSPGQTVTQETVLFTIADLSTVWIDFAVYPTQLAHVHRGEPVVVAPQSGGGSGQEGTVDYVGPSLEEGAGISVGRVILKNAGRWEPGLFVNVAVTVDHVAARVAVPEEAILRTSDGPAVFIGQGTHFRRQAVQVGPSDGHMTEIVSGVEPGAPVVVKNAFNLKSELEKSKYEED
jgi:membrane fusion protein, heavy metal efflux system